MPTGVRMIGSRIWSVVLVSAEDEATRVGTSDLARGAGEFEPPDEPRGAVELNAVDAVPRAGWVSVVQAVPALSHADGEWPEVARSVVAAGAERSRSEHVADGVHRPGDVMEHRDADKAGPQQRADRTGKPSGDEPAEEERREHADGCDDREQPVDQADVGVGEQVGSVCLWLRGGAGEQPANMRVEQAAQLCHR